MRRIVRAGVPGAHIPLVVVYLAGALGVGLLGLWAFGRGRKPRSRFDESVTLGPDWALP